MQLCLHLLTTKSLFTSSFLCMINISYIIQLTKQYIRMCIRYSLQRAHVSLLISTYYLNINQHWSLYLLDAMRRIQLTQLHLHKFLVYCTLIHTHIHTQYQRCESSFFKNKLNVRFNAVKTMIFSFILVSCEF